MKTKKINRGGFAVVADPAFAEGSTARLVTGHSLQWLKAQPSKSISIFFFSPPYNKRLRRKRGSREGGTWSGAALLVDGYASYSDDMPHDLYVQWMHDLLTECWRVLKDDGAIFFQHKDQQYRGVTITPDELNPGLPLRQRIIWDRGSGPCSNYNFLRPSYEFIYLFAKPKFKFGTSGKIMDVLRIAPAKSSHPAPFPVELPHRIFQQLKPEHDVICDVFSGSGSTGVAARATGRHYVGIDIDAGYNEEAAERLNCTVETLAAPEPRKRLSVKATLFNDDCLKSMAKLPDESVHLIAIDLPYGVSAEAWDKIVPMAKMFAEFRRILTPTGNIVMTAQGRFTAAFDSLRRLTSIAIRWSGRKPVRPSTCIRTTALSRSMRTCWFSQRAAWEITPRSTRLTTRKVWSNWNKPITSRNGNQKDSFYKVSGLAAERGRFQTHTNYPSSILYFPSVGGKEKVKGKGNAPQTQKPVALMDYLIRTYSNSGDTVLDCTMGSGTTGVAALQAERNFIGMEISPRFFENTVTRLQASAPNAMFVVSGPEPVQPDLVDQIIAKKRAAYWASRKSADVVTLVAACRTKPPTPDIIIDDLCDYLIAA